MLPTQATARPWKLGETILAALLLGLALLLPARAAAADPVVRGEILVRLSNAAEITGLLNKYGLTLIGRFGARPIYRVAVARAETFEATLSGLRRELVVLDAEPNTVHSSPEARMNLPWAIGIPVAYVSQWAPRALQLDLAHQISTGAGIRVAVLDTGVDVNHPALRGRLLPGFDFVDNDPDPSEMGTRADLGFGHGTHVAGLVALAAPGAKIVPLRVLDPAGSGNTWVLAEAMLHAIDPDGNAATDDGAHVINLSLGTVDRTRIMDSIMKLASCTFLDVEIDPTEFADPGYNDDRERCRNSRGAVVVAAAGNGASEFERQYPAAEGGYGLLPVAATAEDGQIAGFSNFGSWIEIAAPGDGITSSVPGGEFGTWSGTSMAAPLVSGSVALLRAFRPELSGKTAARTIERTSRTICGSLQRQVDPLAALKGKDKNDLDCKPL